MLVPMESVDFDTAELVAFASPEPRCTYAAAALAARVTRMWVVDFVDYSFKHPRLSAIDLRVREEYEKNLADLRRIGASVAGGATFLHAGLNHLQLFEDVVDGHDFGAAPSALVIDISTAPRGHLFAVLAFARSLQLAHHRRVCVAYTQVESHEENEDAFSYGMQDVAVVPGFDGTIRIARDVLVVVLGFEGNRAYSLYRRLAPARTELIIGDSRDEQRDFYIATAKRNNHSLLHIHGNRASLMSSRDPDEFSRELGLKLDQLKGDGEYNLYFSCLGTKAQVLGAFLALQSRPDVQVLDALPTRRRFGSGRPVSLLLQDFGVEGLARP